MTQADGQYTGAPAPFTPTTSVVKAAPAWVAGMPSDLMATAGMVAASGYYPDITSVAQAAFKLAVGRDMGFGLVDSLNYIHVIVTKDKDGNPKPPKIHVGYVLLAALVDRHPDYSYKVEKKEDDEARVAFFRRGHLLGVSAFTIEDARRAGLVKSYGNWVQWPSTMLFARAMSHGVKTYCPAVLCGADVRDEEPYIEGHVIEAPMEIHAPPEGLPSPWAGFWARCRERGQDHAYVHAFVGVGTGVGELLVSVEAKAEREGKTLAEVLAELEERLCVVQAKRPIIEARPCASRASPNANAGSCTFDVGHSGLHSWHTDRQLDATPQAKRPIDAIPAHEQQAAYEADEDVAKQASDRRVDELAETQTEASTPEPVHEADPYPPFWRDIEAIGADAAFVLRTAQVRDLAQLKDSLRSASARSKAKVNGKPAKNPREVADLLGDLLLRVSRAWAARTEPPVPATDGGFPGAPEQGAMV